MNSVWFDLAEVALRDADAEAGLAASARLRAVPSDASGHLERLEGPLHLESHLLRSQVRASARSSSVSARASRGRRGRRRPGTRSAQHDGGEDVALVLAEAVVLALDARLGPRRRPSA